MINLSNACKRVLRQPDESRLGKRMPRSLHALWRTRNALIRSIERRETAAPPALAERLTALTAEIAGRPAANGNDLRIKLALMRELAEHAPDQDLLLQLIETAQDALTDWAADRADAQPRTAA